ncbi:hypothetical protein PABG_02724 [Paracoccidioides brasiliensis Pb03]|uniref:Uncharacterized protein n=1 Tax=Paracoccidioides brasiliensis TaxID=121759 RepID=A0A1D2JK27_PARBR|nr:hypothetical protein PABG_02724 [Paracoccidioides brasiliensis Pb03]ODH39283.1 hypothetical protein ACO22_01951 [Paracoccidioides brasiliensis]
MAGNPWGPLIMDPWSPQDHTNPFNGCCHPQASMSRKEFAVFGLTRFVDRDPWTNQSGLLAQPASSMATSITGTYCSFTGLFISLPSATLARA